MSSEFALTRVIPQFVPPVGENERASARSLLKHALTDGPALVDALMEMAALARISQRILRTAKAELGVISVRLSSATGPRWVWQLPKHANQE